MDARLKRRLIAVLGLAALLATPIARASTTTPNLGLTLPDLQSSGPQWASDLNSNFTKLDFSFLTPLTRVGTSIRINDASTVAKGAAQFSASHFAVTSGVVSILTGSIGATELAATTVVPGSYANATLAIDADGRVTSANSGSLPGVGASYLTLGLDSTLTAERVLTAGTGLSFVDGGVNSTLTVNLANTAVTPGAYSCADVTVDAQGRLTAAATGACGGAGGAPTGAIYLVLNSLDATLTQERRLVAGTGLGITDAGANNTATLALANTAVTPGSYTYTALTVDAQGRLTAASTGTTPAPTSPSYLTLANDATLTAERRLLAGPGITFTDAGANSSLTVNNNGVLTVTASSPVSSSGGQNPVISCPTCLTSTPAVAQFTRVGIGAASTIEPLLVAGTGFTYAYIKAAGNAAEEPGLQFLRARNTIGAPSTVLSGNVLGAMYWLGWDGSAYNSSASFKGTADENWSGAARGSRFDWSTTPRGSITGATVMQLLDTGGLAVRKLTPEISPSTDGFPFEPRAMAFTAGLGTLASPVTTSLAKRPVAHFEMIDATPDLKPETAYGNPEMVNIVSIEGRESGGANLNGLGVRVTALNVAQSTSCNAPNVPPCPGDVHYGDTLTGGTFAVESNAVGGIHRSLFALNPIVSWQGGGTAPPNMVGIEIDIINAPGSSDTLIPGVSATNFTAFWATAAAAGRAANTAFFANAGAAGSSWRHGVVLDGPFTQWSQYMRNTSGHGVYLEVAGSGAGVLALEVRQGASSGAAQAPNRQFTVTGESSDPVYIRVGGVLKQVVIGAPDSCTTNFRCLRVAN